MKIALYIERVTLVFKKMAFKCIFLVNINTGHFKIMIISIKIQFFLIFSLNSCEYSVLDSSGQNSKHGKRPNVGVLLWHCPLIDDIYSVISAADCMYACAYGYFVKQDILILHPL